MPQISLQTPIGQIAAQRPESLYVMEHEHESAGSGLRRLHELTNGYRVPDDACAAYRGLYDSLQRLEADLHAHIHKENNILFPRAIQLENPSRSPGNPRGRVQTASGGCDAR
jgi:iron-sulfur cluster repair protein YtfE (RIC family)